MKHGKIWGLTWEILSTAGFSVHALRIRRGGFSSIHRHVRKSNLFFCIEGALDIRIWQPDLQEPDITSLQAGEATRVPAGVFHQFEAIAEDTRIIEIYELEGIGPESLERDIERKSPGGIHND